MATYRVVPDADGDTQRYGWKVLKNGRRISNHTVKSAAKRTADRKAGTGDSVIVHRMNGTVQGPL